MNIKQFLIDNNYSESLNFYTIKKLCSYRGDNIHREMSDLIRIISIDNYNMICPKSDIIDRYKVAKKHLADGNMRIINEILNKIDSENKTISNTLKKTEYEINAWIKIINSFGNRNHQAELDNIIMELGEEFDSLFTLINTEIYYYETLLPHVNLSSLKC